MIDLLTSFPTVVFTFLLAVCVLWWLASMLLAGLDADVDADGADGLADQLGFSAMPLPLALSLLALGGFAVTATLQSQLESSAGKQLALGVGIGILLAGAVGGLIVVKVMSKPLGKVFAIQGAPTRAVAVGSFCKIRTLDVSDRTGDAEITTGPLRGSIVHVRAAEGRFTRGDLAHIIDFDRQRNIYVIDDIDPALTIDAAADV
jgi:hypothetical protein